MQQRRVWFLTMMAAFLLAAGLFPGTSPAQGYRDFRGRTQIVNLEAKPKWFKPGDAIEFLVAIRHDGDRDDGFDIGVFHEGRLVGWERNQRLNSGINTYRLRDRNFTGEPGDYIVRLLHRGRVLQERRFKARRDCLFTIDPTSRPPRWSW